jgi:hypothetical protein
MRCDRLLELRESVLKIQERSRRERRFAGLSNRPRNAMKKIGIAGRVVPAGRGAHPSIDLILCMMHGQIGGKG